MSQKNTLFSYFGKPTIKKNAEKNSSNAEESKKNGVDGKRSRDTSESPPVKKKFLESGSCKDDSGPPPEKKACLVNGSSKGTTNKELENAPTEANARSISSGKKKTPDESPRPKKKFSRIITHDDSSDESDDQENGVNSSVSSPKTPKNTLQKFSQTELQQLQSSFLEQFSRTSSVKKTETDKGEDTENTRTETPKHFKPKCLEKSLKRQSSTLDDSTNISAEVDEESDGGWTHLKLEFLKPENIRDAEKRRPTDPKYNAKTLYVPESFKKTLTPAMYQWWEIKSSNFDSIIFFKVGKFYELYHMDAVVGFAELDLSYMKGDHAHSGFPEMAFGKFSAELIHKGYKVARVEQTETPEMMEQRCSSSAKKTTKYDKVVRREVCQLITKGTITFGIMDVDLRDTDNHYLLSITEMTGSSVPTFGVCFIDTSIATFHFGQFSDDRYRSRLRTLLAHYPPVQVLLEKDSVSYEAQRIIDSTKSVVRKDVLIPKTEFWTAEETLVFLREGQYFKDDSGKEETGNREKYFPKAFWPYLNSSDPMSLSPNSDGELAIKALGGCLWYLKECVILDRILSLKQFSSYTPVDAGTRVPVSEDEGETVKLPNTMILDGSTLRNLNILGESESLLEKLDYSVTPFGKRLLRLQLCNPLCNRKKIIARQEAIRSLLKNADVAKEARSLMQNLPDLERRLIKIHAFGYSDSQGSHPDDRAIFYEDKVYSKRKIIDFISTLNAFKTAVTISSLFADNDACGDSVLLKKYMCTHSHSEYGIFPDMRDHLKFFEDAFDHEKARKEGVIIPEHGVDEQYDAYIEAKKKLEKDTKEYLEEQRKFFKEKVTFIGSGKKRYQLEVPEHACKRATNDYHIVSSRKGYKRYVTEETQNFVNVATSVEDMRKEAMNGINKNLFQKFSSRADMWLTAVNCLGELDVLLSLAEYSRNVEEETCVPTIVDPVMTEKPYLRLIEGKHPCVSWVEKFVPNDVAIGCDDVTSLIVLTGPNMGGKSTLMRQLSLLVILSQMGCLVPASSFELTLVDRIFTRIGARDDAMVGESTFFIELSETATICAHASTHSLVLVDELGRGTSTYDGCAIACAVVNKLRTMGCRTIFSTHYHLLVESFKSASDVYFAHMACAVENEGTDDPTEEVVTFLYKLVKGVCPKSYGLNAAKLGGISSDLIRKAFKKAEELERKAETKKLLKQLLSKSLDSNNCNQLLPSMALICV